MTDNDTVIWRIEGDPILRSTVTSAWLLGSRPTRARMDAVVERMIERLPRLRQRVVEDGAGVLPPRWEEDPYFDVDHHYHWTRLAGRAPGRRQALDYIAILAARAFDKDRPLWELTMVEGLPGKRAVFIMKVHHAIADGLGMVQMLEHMVDLEADPADEPRPAADAPGDGDSSRRGSATGRGIRDRLGADAHTAARFGMGAMSVAKGLLSQPVTTVKGLAGLSESVAKVVAPASTPLSPLLTGRSLSTRFDTIILPLADLKAGAKAGGGSLNDGFVAGVLSGLDRYHRELGTPCEQVRMHMPVSIRGGETANQSSNQFVPTRMVLPLGELPPRERLHSTKQLLADVRAEPAIPLMGDISAAISRMGRQATISVIGSIMKGVDITTSNVPGPPFPVWMAGRSVDEFFAFGPLAGSAINLTLFSYNGAVNIGVNTDRAAVADPERFVRCLEEGLAEIVALATGESDDSD
ncbi:MAG: wax ester/triacylglycerol synthase family O-acyltransferase [Acidimicrobiales bacterium]